MTSLDTLESPGGIPAARFSDLDDYLTRIATATREAGELERLITSWNISMRARRLSPRTIECYELGAKLFLRWCAGTGTRPALHRPDAVTAWLAEVADTRAASTVYNRYQGMRAFCEWLHKADELAVNGMLKVERPGFDLKDPGVLTTAQRDAVLAACLAGAPGRPNLRFTAIRDHAMFSLLFESMLRAREMTALMINPRDVDLKEQTVHVKRGKGRKERYSGFGVQTAASLDRYERARRKSRLAGSDAYWLGTRGPLCYDGLRTAFKTRAAAAGIDPATVHLHMLRGGGAVDWRRRGGTIEALMELGGWTGVEMPNHYTAVANRELALAEARKMFDR